MRDALVELLEKTDLATALCEDVVSPDRLESFAHAARNIRTRLSYPEDVVVAADDGFDNHFTKIVIDQALRSVQLSVKS